MLYKRIYNPLGTKYREVDRMSLGELVKVTSEARFLRELIGFLTKSITKVGKAREHVESLELCVDVANPQGAASRRT